jgi:hypothetical protein
LRPGSLVVDLALLAQTYTVPARSYRHRGRRSLVSDAASQLLPSVARPESESIVESRTLRTPLYSPRSTTLIGPSGDRFKIDIPVGRFDFAVHF